MIYDATGQPYFTPRWIGFRREPSQENCDIDFRSAEGKLPEYVK